MPISVELYVSFFMTLEQSSTCNLVKFLGGVPNLERV